MLADTNTGATKTGTAVAILGLIGGLGVVVAAQWGRSVWATAAMVGGPSAAVAVLGWRVASPEVKARVLGQVKAGLVAGILGLVAYDVTRWTIVAVFGVSINPFEAFPVFGELLTGSDSATVNWVAGTGYHIFNGTGFAIFYAIMFGTRGIRAGVLWAIALEAATLLIYPGWLDIRTRGEFTAVSMGGHIAYGITIGAVSARLLRTGADR